MNIPIIKPDWPAPAAVKAFTTTRYGGFSQGCFTSFNLAEDLGDNPQDVAANRKLLQQELQLPSEPLWLKQVHSNTIFIPEQIRPISKPIADGTFTSHPNTVCIVTTADCLPILLCDSHGTEIASVHGGWRGLAAGIIEQALQQFSSPANNLLAWLGPAIGPGAYEVGAEVRAAFIKNFPDAHQAFLPSPNEDRFYADLYLLAKQRLLQQGVKKIYGGNFCTYTENDRFFSYRRDRETGRMASVIWLENPVNST